MTVTILLFPALWLNRGLRSSGLWQALWWTELGLLSLAWCLALMASGLAWFRHRSVLGPILAVAGLAVLTLTILSPLHGRSPWISAVALFGGLLVASAHLLNLRRSHRSGPTVA